MKDATRRTLKVVYGITATVAVFTGFGNMPLWKRYYVADIPGLGWSGDFLINLNVHIIAGSMLLALAVFALTTALLAHRRTEESLTAAGKIQAGLLASTLATGIVMAAKNLPAVQLPMAALIAFNLAHMGTAMLFMLAALIALALRLPWRRSR